MTFYDKVKKAAEAEGLTIAELERKANVANGTISKWRKGYPRVETLAKVASVLNTEMSALMPF